MGHKFKIKTLTQGEQLEVASVHAPWVNTLGEVKAYQSAIVAGCLMEVDDKPLPVPITNTPSDTLLAGRFEYVNNLYFPPTIEVVYQEYLTLEGIVFKVLKAVSEASPLGQPERQ